MCFVNLDLSYTVNYNNRKMNSIIKLFNTNYAFLNNIWNILWFQNKIY